MRAILTILSLSTLGLALLGHPGAALSQECNPADESQAGMNICAAAGFKAEDARLNKTYRKIVARLADDPNGKKLLLAAQRDWIAFRDAECAFATAGSAGGSIHPMLVSDCLAGLTKARAEQLAGYLDCEEGDTTCPVPPGE